MTPPAPTTRAPGEPSTTCAGPARGRRRPCSGRRAAGALALAAVLELLSAASTFPPEDLGPPGASRPATVPGQRSAAKPAPAATPLSHSVPPLIAPASVGAYARERGAGGESSRPARPQVGLRVHPPVAWLPAASPGTDVTLPAPITIENCGAHPVRCSIEPIQPSSIGIRYMSGYSDIPDPSWCRVELEALALRPGESRSIEIVLSIPQGACNFNKCWCVAFSIQSDGGSSVGAAAYPYVYIETQNQVGVTRPSEMTGGTRAQPPDLPRGTGTPQKTPDELSRVDAAAGTAPRQPGEGTAAAAPADAPTRRGCVTVDRASIDAGDVPAGATASAGAVTLRNRYDRDVLLSFAPLAPPERGVARGVLITPGHKWMEDTSWVRTDRRSVLLPAGGEVELGVEVVDPGDPSKLNFRWEGLVEINGPWGPEALVRVRWRTTAPSPERESGEGGRP
jgi:hypothetical protein